MTRKFRWLGCVGVLMAGLMVWQVTRLDDPSKEHDDPSGAGASWGTTEFAKHQATAPATQGPALTLQTPGAPQPTVSFAASTGGSAGAPTVSTDESFRELFTIEYKSTSNAPGKAGGLHAPNPTNGFDALFRSEEVIVTPAVGDAEGRTLSMRLAQHGRGGAVKASSPVMPALKDGRVEYTREGMTEWYENGPEGLEQGFDVPSRPPGDGPLRLAFAVGGDLHAVVSPPADRIEFKDETGEDVYWFDKLHVFDARNEVLPARFGWHDDGFEIIVEDDGAVYPITIDPLLSAPGWNFWGSQTGSMLGWSVSGAGDVNGDGYADMIVGAPQFNGPAGENSGRVYVFHGSPNGFSNTPALILDGPVAGGRFGETVAGIGDINADGYSEVAIGAPHANDEAGQIYVYAGSPTGLNPTPVYQRAGDVPGDQWGWCISATGDTNGSGYADFVVTAPGATGGGAAAVFYGGPAIGSLSVGTWLNGGIGADAFGLSCTGGGDLTGDGYADLAISDPYFDHSNDEYRGRVHIFYGAPAGISLAQQQVLNPPNAVAEPDDLQQCHWPLFGYSVSMGGDLNGDGYADLVVAAPVGCWVDALNDTVKSGGNTPNTAYIRPDIVYPYGSFVYAYRGFSDGVEIEPYSFHNGQTSVDVVGDANGDGLADVVSGQPLSGYISCFIPWCVEITEPGWARLLFGSQSSPSFGGSWDGAGNYDAFGFSVAALGDVNGDGFADFAMGAPRTLGRAGRVYVVFGSPLPPRASESAFYEVSGDAKSVGDLNGDGFGDFLIGREVYLGTSGPQLASQFPTWIAPATATFVGSAGDVNQNGRGDIIIVFPEVNPDSDLNINMAVYDGNTIGVGVLPVYSGVPYFTFWNLGFHYVLPIGDVRGDGSSSLLSNVQVTYSQSARPHLKVFDNAGLFTSFIQQPSQLLDSEPVQVVEYGRVATPLGDFTGNGVSDFLLTEPGTNPEVGDAFLESSLHFFLGSASQGAGSPISIGPFTIDFSESLFDSASGLGDVNGNGLGDYCVDGEVYFGGGLIPYSGIPDSTLPKTPGNYIGDATNDGYADVLAGNSLYRGGVAGVAQTPIWTAQIEGVARSAGDVNGDGYPDIIISNGTETHIYLGNGGQGVPMVPRQSKVVPLGEPLAAPHARTGSLDSVRLSLMARAPVGRTNVKLQWEIKPHNKPFDGTNLGESANWVDTGLIPQELAAVAQVPEFSNGYRWRVRLLYDPIQNPVHRHSPWYSPVWPYPTSADFRTFIDYEDPTTPGVTLERVPTAGNPDPAGTVTTTDDLVATVVTPSSFHPEVAQEYIFEWSNGLRTWPVNAQPSASMTSTLPAAETRKGETWTCTVRAFDGGNYSEAVAIAKAIVNTPPSAPEIEMPPVVSSSANLVCRVTAGSVDPDNDPISYSFAWFVKRDGETEFSPFFGAVDDPANRLSLVDSDFTDPDDEWYCIVTPSDNEVTGSAASTLNAPTSVVEGGITPSFIAVDVNPESIVLGQSVQLTAEILPNAGNLSSTVKRFDVTPTTGDGFSVLALTESGNLFSASHLPNHASEGGSPWQITASWAGNPTYQSATSTQRSLTVLKAQPTLTVQMVINSGPLGLPNVADTDVIAQVSLKAPLPPSLQSLLEGLPIRLNLRDPKGQFRGAVETSGSTGQLILTDAAGVATFRFEDFLEMGVDFEDSDEDAGTWQLQAEFASNSNFKSAFSAGYDEPATPRLIIKDGAGYAIICVGRLPSGEGLAEHNKTGDFVYRTLLDRGLGHDEIYYLRQGDPPPFAESNIDASSTSFDTAPSKAGLQVALDWARTRMNASPAPLWIILLDHGLPGEFFVYSGVNDISRLITPQELNGYLNNLESNLSQNALSEGITVVYGACNSGSFIPALSKPGRTVITSTRADEKSHRGTRDPVDGVRDGELFTTEFFRGLRSGMNVTIAFQAAAARVREFTLNSSNFATGEPPQTPLLDDNGNGSGRPAAQLVYAGAGDGAKSYNTILGVGLNTGESLSWVESTQTTVLAPGEPIGQLFARSQVPVPPGTTAWIEVKQPSYDRATRVDDQDEENQQEFLNLASFNHEPGISDVGNGTFRWQTFGDTFAQPGAYSVYFFVRDGGTGDVGAHLLAKVFRQTADREPPPPVVLTFPDDGAIIGTTSFFAWNPVMDADGQPVTYTIEMADANDPNFNTILVQKEGIVGWFVKLTPEDGLLDGQAYRWRVRPVDSFGLSPATHATRLVQVDQGNPDAFGTIGGRVLNAANSTPIGGVSVTVKSGPTTPLPGMQLTLFNGEFAFLGMWPGLHALQFEATNFQTKSNQWANVISGSEADMGNILLQPVTGQFVWGDVTGNSIAGTLDAREILRWINFEITSFPIAPSVTWPQFPPGADVNGSGSVNVLDMVAILRKLTGAITRFPADLNGDGFGPDAGKSTANFSGKETPTVLLQLIPQSEPVAGETVKMDVRVDDAAGLAGYTLQVDYDTAVLTYTQFENAPATASWLSGANEFAPGSVRFSGGSSQPLAQGGTIATLTFIVQDGTEGLTTPLQFTHAELFTDDGVQFLAEAENLALTIPGADFHPMDINRDGRVDAVDVQLIINAALGLSIEPYAVLDADVNGDGAVNAVDVQLVIIQVLGL